MTRVNRLKPGGAFQARGSTDVDVHQPTTPTLEAEGRGREPLRQRSQRRRGVGAAHRLRLELAPRAHLGHAQRHGHARVQDVCTREDEDEHVGLVQRL